MYRCPTENTYFKRTIQIFILHTIYVGHNRCIYGYSDK